MANGHGGRREGAGRKKGGTNHVLAKTRDLIWEKCQAKGVDPFSATIDLLDHADVSVRLTAAKNLMPYLLNQLQRTELVGKDEGKVEIEVTLSGPDSETEAADFT